MIEAAASQQRLEIERDAEEAKKYGVDCGPSAPILKRLPPLVIPMRDMGAIELLQAGIAAALEGSKDPFGIRPPRGIKPMHSEYEIILICADLLNEIEKNKGSFDDPTKAALDTIMNKKSTCISIDRLKDAMSDNELMRLAKLHNDFWQRRINYYE